MNSKEIASLIKCFNELGNSPKMRIYAIRGLLTELHQELNSEQIESVLQQVLKPLELEAAQHTQRGSTFGKKKSKARAKKTYDHPGYCETLQECQCSTCHQSIMGRGFVFHDREGNWFYYHPIEECWPQEHKAVMKQDRKWLKAMRPQQEAIPFMPYADN